MVEVAVEEYFSGQRKNKNWGEAMRTGTRPSFQLGVGGGVGTNGNKKKKRHLHFDGYCVFDD